MTRLIDIYLTARGIGNSQFAALIFAIVERVL